MNTFQSIRGIISRTLRRKTRTETNYKGCTRIDRLRNEDIRNELGIFPLHENLQNIETNGKYINKGWNRLAFYFKPIDIIRLIDKIQEDQKKS
jgi:hypothetical protein